MVGNQLHGLVELKSTMEGLVSDLEQNLDRVLMEDGSQTVEEVMVIEDVCKDKVNC